MSMSPQNPGIDILGEPQARLEMTKASYDTAKNCVLITVEF